MNPRGTCCIRAYCSIYVWEEHTFLLAKGKRTPRTRPYQTKLNYASSHHNNLSRRGRMGGPCTMFFGQEHMIAAKGES
jgi:hypothetical protein